MIVEAVLRNMNIADDGRIIISANLLNNPGMLLEFWSNLNPLEVERMSETKFRIGNIEVETGEPVRRSIHDSTIGEFPPRTMIDVMTYFPVAQTIIMVTH